MRPKKLTDKQQKEFQRIYARVWAKMRHNGDITSDLDYAMFLYIDALDYASVLKEEIVAKYLKESTK